MLWADMLTRDARLGFTVNALTRIRFCDLEGRLELQTKGDTHNLPDQFIPWFKFPKRASQNLNIIFGHWAALRGKTGLSNVHALDTGCDYGHALTAMRLEDGKRTCVSCP